MDINNSDLFLILFSRIKGVGSSTLRKIYQTFGDFEKAYSSDIKQFQKIIRKKDVLIQIENLLRTNEDDMSYIIKNIKKNLIKNKIKLVSYFNEIYPESLKKIKNPPIILYIKGQLLFNQLEKSISIVGTRNPSLNGHIKARRIAKELAENGYIIISGLARGIDLEAHIGALEGKGKTIAVISSGIDKIYPPEHEELVQDILKDGMLISEKGLEREVNKWGLRDRNRIISGLSNATLIIEGSWKSGTRIELELAKNQNKLIFALEPDNTQRKVSELPQYVISDIGIPIKNTKDILEYFNYILEKKENLSRERNSKIIKMGNTYMIINKSSEYNEGEHNLSKILNWKKIYPNLNLILLNRNIKLKDLLFNIVKNFGGIFIILNVYKNDFYLLEFLKGIPNRNQKPIILLFSINGIYSLEYRESYYRDQLIKLVDIIKKLINRDIENKYKRDKTQLITSLDKYLIEKERR
ncbi:MAG: DNA-processing protein DprA [Promethearchaeia archaeon]